MGIWNVRVSGRHWVTFVVRATSSEEATEVVRRSEDAAGGFLEEHDELVAEPLSPDGQAAVLVFNPG